MDGYVKIGTKLDTKSFDAQIDYVESQLDEIEHKVKQADMGFEVGDTQKLEAQYEKLSIQLTTLKKKQADFNKADLTRAQKNIEKVGNSTSKVIKKLGKWALGVFAIESAYGFVRTSMSKLSEYNEQIKTDTEYISYAVATGLQPVVERLIALAYKLLTMINGISLAWFGVNLFANASADAMKKATRSAEKMKKSLAGFDEMNVLGESGGGIGGGTEFKPLKDLSDITGTDTTKAKNFWKSIFEFWEKDWLNWYNNADGNWNAFISGLILTGKGLYDTIKGVFQMLGGLFTVVVGVFQGDFDKISQGWNKMCEGFKTIFVGAFRIITGVLLTVTGTIKGIFLDLVQGIYRSVIKPIGSAFSSLWHGILSGLNAMFSAFKRIMGALWGVVKIPLNLIISGINLLIRGLNRIHFDVPDWLPIIGGRKFGFSIRQIPYLAKGGIVSMPNRGVPVGGAMAGESGREGVLPLTDAQAMQELGNAIGKYITINANITNTMNGRIISRELQRIKSDDDFAFNR